MTDYQAHVVCIDDEPGVIELVRLILKPERIKVTGGHDGRRALQLIREAQPDMVLLDIMMPEMDGWEVYRRIRADQALQDLPVVILTARSSSFEEVIARERAGVNDYVTKPFMPASLRNSIHNVLGLTSHGT